MLGEVVRPFAGEPSARALRFDAVRNFSAGVSPGEAVKGDFDGDGRLDLVVASGAVGQGSFLQLLRGNGDGTFASPEETSVLPRRPPYALSVADFDGDGRVDVVAADYRGLYLARNQGDGHFGAPEGFTSGWRPGVSAAVDVDGDRRADVVATDPDNNRVHVLRNQGGGSFALVGTYETGSNPFEVAVGDFNRDRRPDLAVADYDNQVTVLLNTGNGSFQPLESFAAGGPTDLAVADVDDDRRLDLLVASSVWHDAPENTVEVFLGNGDGTFRPGAALSLPEIPVAIATGDFNDDGASDLAVIESTRAQVFFGEGDGTFHAPWEVLSGGWADTVVAGNFHRDRSAELVLVGGVVTLLKGDDGDGFSATPSMRVSDSPLVAPVLADVDHDELPDLVVSEPDTASLKVLLGDGEAFDTPITLPVGSRMKAVAVGDFNRDHEPDLLALDEDVDFLRGDGTGAFLGPVGQETGIQPAAFAVGHFDSDRRLDVAVVGQANGSTSDADGRLSLLRGRGNGSFDPPVVVNAPGRLSQLVARDLNGDQRVDLVGVANAISPGLGGALYSFLGNGDGTFQQAIPIPVDSVGWVHAVVVRDLDGDGRADVAVTFSGYRRAPGGVAVARGNGDGTFTALEGSAVAGFPYGLAAGDFDRDGRVDLAVTQNNNSVAVLRGNGDGTFVDSPGYVAVPEASAVVAGDLDDNGELDLVVTGQLGHVGYLFNTSR